MEKNLKILFVGLGNREVTPDALGPLCGRSSGGKPAYSKRIREICDGYGAIESGLSAIVPGVMGQTGMETAEIVRGIVRETQPDLVIAVDALAARNSRRLNRTIQIADTGIHPGSGVGNHRNGMTRRISGGSGDRNRSAHGCGCGNDRQ